MPRARLVKSLDELKPGDQISFLQELPPVFYHHHAIVFKVARTEMVMFSFTDLSPGRIPISPSKSQQNGPAACVRQETVTRANFRNEKVYVYDYDGECASDAEVVRRAQSVERREIPWGDYDLVNNNCEHFATWCKTGVKSSKQVEAVSALMQGAGAMFGSMLSAWK